MEENFLDFEQALDKKIQNLRENLSKIQKIVQEDRFQKEQIFENKQKEIYSLDQKLNQLIDNEIMTRREGENKIIRAIEDKDALLKTQINRERKLRQDAIDQLNQCLELEIPKLNEGIKSQANQREDMDLNIMKKSTEEILKIRNLIESE